jgi:hypothetical protein
MERIEVDGSSCEQYFFCGCFLFKKGVGQTFCWLADVGTKGLTDPLHWEPGMIGVAKWKMRGMM